LIAGVAVAAIVVPGCGIGNGAATGPVTLTITRGSGGAPVAAATVAHPRAGSTALDVLKRRFEVATGPGRSIRAIEGVTAGPGERWRLYVNGVAAGPGTGVHSGDRLWWVLADSSVAPTAVVGSFPEPFRHGLAGRRLPASVECAGDVPAACVHVTAVLGHAGVPTASQLLGAGSGQDSLVVVVGTWHDISRELAATLLARGPAASGVFARFVGGSLKLLDWRGVAVVTLRSPAGLIAALAQRGAPPTWLVVGTNAAGTAAAAEALSAGRLRDHFALAVSGGRDLAVPR
jgi:hypothetical protein